MFVLKFDHFIQSKDGMQIELILFELLFPVIIDIVWFLVYLITESNTRNLHRQPQLVQHHWRCLYHPHFHFPLQFLFRYPTQVQNHAGQ